METCQEKNRVEKTKRNNNKPKPQSRSDVEDLHACLIAKEEPREECRRGQIEVSKQHQIYHGESDSQNCEQRDGAGIVLGGCVWDLPNDVHECFEVW